MAVLNRHFKIDPDLGDVLDAMLGQQLEKRVTGIKAELAAREITESTRRVFVSFGWLQSAAGADPRLVEIMEPESSPAKTEPLRPATVPGLPPVKR